MHLIFYADVYGFSNKIIHNMDETFHRIDEFQKLFKEYLKVRTTSAQAGLPEPKLHFFSDNLFLIAEVESREAVAEFFKSVTKLVEYSLLSDIDMPLRGVIQYGLIRLSSRTIVGKPVLESVEFEKNIRLPLIFIPEQVIKNLDKDGLMSKEINAFLGEPKDFEFKDGITSAYTLIGDNNVHKSLCEYAHLKYEEYRVNPSKAKPADAWLKTNILLSEMRGTKNE